MNLSLQRRARWTALGGTIVFHLLALSILSFWGFPPPDVSPSPLQIEVVPSVPDSSSAMEGVLPETEAAGEVSRMHEATSLRSGEERNGRVLYSVKWVGGGKRRKIGGVMPKLLSGAGKPGMVQIELVVTGAGAVRTARLAQAGDSRYNDMTLRDVRSWKFDPLPPRLRKSDQRCTVTLSFIPG
jgi:TonB family protein